MADSVWDWARRCAARPRSAEPTSAVRTASRRMRLMMLRGLEKPEHVAEVRRHQHEASGRRHHHRHQRYARHVARLKRNAQPDTAHARDHVVGRDRQVDAVTHEHACDARVAFGGKLHDDADHGDHDAEYGRDHSGERAHRIGDVVRVEVKVAMNRGLGGARDVLGGEEVQAVKAPEDQQRGQRQQHHRPQPLPAKVEAWVFPVSAPIGRYSTSFGRLPAGQ